jgi:hypothetical protein
MTLVGAAPRLMSALVVAVALAAAATSARQAADGDVTLDGRIDEAEWKTASTRPLEGGGTVHLMVRGSLLYVGIRGPASGTAHVCVGMGDTVRILHVSAAVGSATYRRSDGAWTLQTPFTWSLRDPALTGPPAQARAAYLKKEGWVGTVSSMGPGTDREIVIDRSRFGSQRLRLAVAFVPTGDNQLGPVSRWPDSRDHCADQGTVAGFLPEKARFLVDDWAVVQ